MCFTILGVVDVGKSCDERRRVFIEIDGVGVELGVVVARGGGARVRARGGSSRRSCSGPWRRVGAIRVTVMGFVCCRVW